MKLSIHNAETNKTIERDADFAEQEQFAADLVFISVIKAKAEAKRQAALAKLVALGLEEDDLKALGLQE